MDKGIFHHETLADFNFNYAKRIYNANGSPMRDRVVHIVGAGIAGVTLSYYLKTIDPTIDVIVFDIEERVGMRNTSKSAACIRTSGLPTLEDTVVALRTRMFYERFSELISTEGHEANAGIVQSGYLWLLGSEKQMEYVINNQRMLREIGIPAELLSPSETKEIIPHLDVSQIKAAFFSPKDGFVSPTDIVEALYRKALSQGVRFQFKSEVVEIDIQDGELTYFRIRKLNEGIEDDVKTNVLVIAAGAYSKELGKSMVMDGASPEFHIPITPRVRRLFYTPVDTSDKGYQHDAHPLVITPSGAYFRPTSPQRNSGIFTFGYADPNDPEFIDITKDPRVDNQEPEFATIDGQSFPIPKYFWDKVFPRISKYFPLFGDDNRAVLGLSGIKEVSGLYDETEDHRALLGAVRDIKGLYLHTGFSGRGILTQLASAEITGNSILGIPHFFDAVKYDPSRRMKHGLEGVL